MNLVSGAFKLAVALAAMAVGFESKASDVRPPVPPKQPEVGWGPKDKKPAPPKVKPPVPPPPNGGCGPRNPAPHKDKKPAPPNIKPPVPPPPNGGCGPRNPRPHKRVPLVPTQIVKRGKPR
jgi:hypothetical protein